MNIDELKKSGCIIFECIGGSRAYGLANEDSDFDIRGVFVLPKDQFYSFDYQDQINDERNNIVYYELRKFLELLGKNNPSMLELLNVPTDCILYKHPLYDKIKAEDFLSQLCKASFTGYGMSQLKKAYGLNKKIVNPVSKEKKSLVDFCYVLEGATSVSLSKFLSNHGLLAEKCGLVPIANMRELYSIYYDEANDYTGILKNKDSTDIVQSVVKLGEKPIGVLYFNKDGFLRYSKDYNEYWQWVENRNDKRHENSIEMGKNYDRKNMMHVFRILGICEEIGRTGNIVVRPTENVFLKKVRNGEFNYEELVSEAEKKLQQIETIYENSLLPKEPNIEWINQLLINLRKEFYELQQCN